MQVLNRLDMFSPPQECLSDDVMLLHFCLQGSTHTPSQTPSTSKARLEELVMRQSKQLIPVVASTSARDKGKSKGTALTGPKHATAVSGTASGTGSLVGRVKNGVEAAKRGDEPSAGLSKSGSLCCFKHHAGCNDCSIHCSVQAKLCSAYKTCESLAYACFMRSKLIMCAQLSASQIAFYLKHLHNVECGFTVPRRF